MCLVSTYQLADGRLCITSNRDESPDRQAKKLNAAPCSEGILCYPFDISGGTWIALHTGKVQAVVLLNGGHERHTRKSEYKLSRGLVLLDIIKSQDAIDWIAHYSFEEIEPFTMILASTHKIIEFIWDGKLRHFKILDPSKHHLWSSSMLYDTYQRKRRHDTFDTLLDKYTQVSPYDLKTIHLQGQIGDPSSDFIMDCNGKVSTISLTQIILGKVSSIEHHDLINQEKWIFDSITQEVTYR